MILDWVFLDFCYYVSELNDLFWSGYFVDNKTKVCLWVFSFELRLYFDKYIEFVYFVVLLYKFLEFLNILIIMLCDGDYGIFD